MTAFLKYVALDDTNHIVGPSEYTVCMIAIPWGSSWSYDEPSKVCAKCAKRAEDTTEFGASKTPAEPVPVTPVEEPVESKAKATSAAKA